ncbi:glycolate oxidase subunit GlcE [Rhodoblastus sp.]|uniref:glycolate oxidase subunit GlcE n=1 Tax=Rhodoblastus sp. TaxID=1962975 RepID=UPI002616B4BB|nr:glycolate oxidase subunit GlcE [Rhodoblastus sp.]
MTDFRPSDEKQIAEIVAAAAAQKQSLEIVAGGSKRGYGRPVKADHLLDLSRIAGIVNYEAAELILTARPGTSLAAVKAELAAKGQMLAFEPPGWQSLFETNAEPTLGGVLACNIGGPRRARAGAPRDFFLGFSAVNGRGEIWKGGGKVVKNVTGFDVSKLLAGSFGTLSVLTEITLKVMPRPESQCTILLPALADEIAVATMAKALNTPFEVSGVAHLPAEAARRSSVAAVAQGRCAVTALRIEGPAPSVAFRAEALEELFGRGERLDNAASTQFWEEVGEARSLLPDGARVMWRLCPTPSRAAVAASAIKARLPAAETLFDWGGGLVWLSLDAAEAGADAGAAIVRGAMKSCGGHATLIVAPAATRERIAVFEPAPGPLAALKARVKAGFDPLGVFNPGRMQEGL